MCFAKTIKLDTFFCTEKKIIWLSGGDGEEGVCPNIIIMADGGSGTYKTQMADNRIISLLHPPTHAIPKISFSNFFTRYLKASFCVENI